MHAGLIRQRSTSRRAFTLIEALIAVVLTLMLMGMVVTAFGMISGSVNDSRATIGLNDQLRAVKNGLIQDLEGVTVTMLPPRNPANGEGYFVYKEGDFLADTAPATDLRYFASFYRDDDGDGTADDLDGDGDFGDNETPDPDVGDLDHSSGGDHDDVIMFTCRKSRDTFAGLDANGAVIESPIAEVAYFMRGTTLYRRTLLVAPSAAVPTTVTDYGQCDISAHMRGGIIGASTTRLDRTDLATSPTAAYLEPNTLSDLTKPENRFGHQPYCYPHSIDFWGVLGLPTLRETSSAAWPLPVANAKAAAQFVAVGSDTYNRLVLPYGVDTSTVLNVTTTTRIFSPATPPAYLRFDPWLRPLPWNETQPAAGTIPLGTLSAYIATATRGTEDVLMTNVLEFDVKAFDPTAEIRSNGTTVLLPIDVGYPAATTVVGYGAYVDLGYTGDSTDSTFSGDGGYVIGGNNRMLRVYDTWSTHFESDGVDNNQDSTTDPKMSNPTATAEAPPPYDAPLRGIQIRIRAFDPNSRQIRQVTIQHDFLPQ